MRRVVASAVVIVLGVAACLPRPAPWVGDGAEHVMVFGDSLTFQANHGTDGGPPDQSVTFLTDQLVAAGYATSVASNFGATTEDLESVTGEIPEPGADILVIALGTNDLHIVNAAPRSSVEASLVNLDRAILQAAASCVVLIGVADVDTWGLSANADEFNTGLTERADVYGNWATIIDAHPEYLRGDDNIHHTAAGAAAYRDLITTSVDACA